MNIVSLIKLVTCILTTVLVTVASRGDLDPDSFQNTVIEDGRVWVVEFYSGMCGSCQEFAPTWTRIEDSLKSIATGKINIDKKPGMQLAESLGVLEQGIPHVRMFSRLGDTKGRSIMSDEINSDFDYKKIMKTLKKTVAGLTKREDDGFFAKQ